MRLGIPEKHAEAITSRPLALHGIARQTRHGNQTTVEITSTHAKASQIAGILTKVSGFLKRIKTAAEQLPKRSDGSWFSALRSVNSWVARSSEVRLMPFLGLLEQARDIWQKQEPTTTYVKLRRARAERLLAVLARGGTLRWVRPGEHCFPKNRH
jgi:hypothetical protein